MASPHSKAWVSVVSTWRGVVIAKRLIVSFVLGILISEPVVLAMFADQGVKDQVGHRQTLGLRLAGASAWKIADLAAVIAGRKRPSIREEWRAHLSGEDRTLPASRKLSGALGFVVAALRYRLQDAADLVWILADAVLKSRPLSNLVVGMPTVTAATILFRHAGTVGVAGSAESIAAIGGSFYALIRVGRWWRGVKPPDPKARRVQE